jgi:hypothetical protein
MSRKTNRPCSANRRALYPIERGQRRVDVVELLVIARALGADPLDLFAEITRSAGLS